MVNKSLYYAEINGLDPMLTAPSLIGGVITINPTHADAINAIADDDPGFVAYLDNQQEQNRRNAYNSEAYRALQGHVQREETPLQELLDETARIRAEFPYSGGGE